MERGYFGASYLFTKHRDYIAYIEDIIESIDRILRYLDTVNGLEDFLRNEMVIDAVTRNYEIIGEAVNQVPKAVKEKYPQLPWKQTYGLKNFTIHEYHRIDPVIL